jgi:hypothetical protein
MSQSDYIKYKRISKQLVVDSSFNKLPPVLTSQDYTNYAQYTVETTVKNTRPIYNRLTPSGAQKVFAMEKKVTSCPTFLLCKNTNTRPNRVPIINSYSVPTPQPLTIDQINESKSIRTACNCVVHSKYTNAGICKCKTGNFGIVR